MKLLIFTVLILVEISALGQVQVLKPYENLPKTPDAAVFDKIEINTQVNELGVSGVSIPIGMLVTNEIQIPIILKNSNTGIKVTDIETPVGLGWVLDVGGIITRTINGIPDEIGWLNESVNLNNGCLNQDYRRAFYEKQKDSSSDIYRYQLNDKSGYFYFDKYGKLFKVFSSDGFIISPIRENDILIGFYIIDENGVKYKFSSSESSYRRPIGYLPDLNGVGSRASTAWKITEIETLLGDNILFDYEPLVIITPIYSDSYSYTEYTIKDNNTGIETPKSLTHIYQYVDEYKIKIIKNISSKYCKFEFSYTDLQTGIMKKKLSSIREYRQNYFLTNRIDLIHSSNTNIGNRLLLEQVNIYGYKNGIESSFSQKYTFDYNRNLFDFGVVTKDYFGFFSRKALNVYGGGKRFFDQNDGSIDENSILGGSLKKVIYPTGGAVEYELEPNIDKTSTPHLVSGGLRTKSVKYFDINSLLVKKQCFQYGKLLGEVYGGNYWKYNYGISFGGDPPGIMNRSCIWSTKPLIFLRDPKGQYYKSIKVVDQKYVKSLEDEYYSVYSYDAYKGIGVYYPILIKKDLYNLNNFRVKSENYQYSKLTTNTSIGWDIDDAYILGQMYLDCDNVYIGEGNMYYKPLIGFTIGGGDGIYKKEEQVIDYFENGTFLNTVKNNTYNNQMQLSKYSIKVYSDTINDNLITEKITCLKYALDYNVQNSWVNSLINYNIIGRPIDVRTFLRTGPNVKMIEGRQYEYNHKGQLTAEYQCNFDEYKIDADAWSNNTIFSPSFYKIIEYAYDLTTNNLIQQMDRSSIPIGYLWGYNGQYPIIKAINVNSESLNKTIGNQLPKIINGEIVKDSVNRIRAVLMETESPLIVLGYIYHPFGGMSSFIDQNGKGTGYGYDDFGRLKNVNDNDNACLATYDYKHYDEKYYISIDNPVLIFSHAGGNQMVTVSSNIATTIKSNNDWLTISSGTLNGSGSFVVTCSSNRGRMRNGKVTIQSTTMPNTIVKTITISQAGALSVTPSHLDFEYDSFEYKSVNVSSGSSWNIVAKDGSFIIATKVAEEELRIKCSRNNLLSSRSGSVTISNGDFTAVITVSQAASKLTIE